MVGGSTRLFRSFCGGMYEHQLKRLSPEFLTYFGRYMQGEFQYELAISTVPMMQVIPVEESIEVEHQIATYDELRHLIAQAGDHIAIQECLCRKVADMQGKHCQVTDRWEVCMSLGDLADLYVEEGWARRLTHEEALEIARQNEKRVSSCCSDCCSMLSMMRFVPRPADVVASNYYADVDTQLCTGCGMCAQRCPTDAVTSEDTVFHVDLARCIGCGACVPACPEDAIPPMTDEDLRDAILAPKKTFAGRTRSYLLKTFMRVASRFSG